MNQLERLHLGGPVITCLSTQVNYMSIILSTIYLIRKRTTKVKQVILRDNFIYPPPNLVEYHTYPTKIMLSIYPFIKFMTLIPSLKPCIRIQDFGV
ncbi:hypothetical protein HanRHA438_Chr16g0756721 [Helianthus annuus]|nr:hypothetical protein HanIR_Chr16g0809621 [Helianthus annuus]KAJ0835559.1 hypothetical protein HanRHA438_Chr16g0756721 [Helianthus annuus]